MSAWGLDRCTPIWGTEDFDAPLLEGRDTAHLDSIANCSSCGTVCTRGWSTTCDFCGDSLESIRLRLAVAETKPPPPFKGELLPAVPGSQAELWHQALQRETERRERQWQVECQVRREDHDHWRLRWSLSSRMIFHNG